jgi:hypothetical protein
MNTSRLWLLAPVALMMAVSAGPAMAADPTIREVYAAARAGQVDKALDMMNVVLKDHPNSAKAHYIEAELLAHQHRYAEARTELAKAETLAPGLPGIQPQSVAALKAQLNGGPTTKTGTTAGTVAGTVARSETAAPQASQGFPWGLAIIGGLIVFAILAFMRRRNRAESFQPPMGGNPYGGNPYGGSQGGPGFGQGYGAPQQGGFGSGLIGNLAAGAAAGVGIAAGSRLIDGMFGGHDQASNQAHEKASEPQWNPDDANRDMGGNDFGIADDSSWDSSGGSDEW